jgi:hypothetical protein
MTTPKFRGTPEGLPWPRRGGSAQGDVTDELRRGGATIATGVASIVIRPVWFAMDAKGAASADAAALKARQEYLVNLAGQRCAGARPPVAPPR